MVSRARALSRSSSSAMFMNCGQTALIRARTFDKRLSRNIFLHCHPRLRTHVTNGAAGRGRGRQIDIAVPVYACTRSTRRRSDCTRFDNKLSSHIERRWNNSHVATMSILRLAIIRTTRRERRWPFAGEGRGPTRYAGLSLSLSLSWFRRNF